MGWILLPILAFVVAALHVQTRGRSSPVAAAGFILGGPTLFVVALVVIAAGARKGAELPRSDTLAGILARSNLLLVSANTGLFAAACAAVVYSALYRDELRGLLSDESQPSPRPVASAALRALGLDSFATPEDVERAYRSLAKTLHPDHGGSDADFKRLHKNYERAKRLVRRAPLANL